MIELVTRRDVVLERLDQPPHWQRTLEERSGEVAEHWRRACAQNRSLFDGRLFCVQERRDRAERYVLTGDFLDYRFFHAQRHGGVELGLDFVAVNGLVHGPSTDRILVGRRSEDSASWPGAWELVPSGTLDESGTDPLDWRSHLDRELEEECGLEVDGWRSLGVLYDSRSRLFEIAAEASARTSELATPFPEHTEIAFVDPQVAARHLSGDDAVPTNRRLFEIARERLLDV